MLKRNHFVGWLAALLPLSAYANIPDTTVPLDNDINTVWVVGNYHIVAEAFNGIAMFFTGGSDSYFMGLMLLGAMIGLAVAICSTIMKQKMEAATWLFTLILMSILFLPRTSVQVASYYDRSGGTGIGAVSFRKVDNIPIGIVYPLAMFTTIGKSITEKFDTAFQILPETGSPSAWAGASFLARGQEGYFSPLKMALRLQHAYKPSDEFYAENLKNTINACQWRGEAHQDRFAKGGSFLLFSPSRAAKQGGSVDYKFRTSGNEVVSKPVYCNEAGTLLTLAVLKDLQVDSSGMSELGKQMTPSLNHTSLSELSKINAREAGLRREEEIKVFPTLLAMAINGKESSDFAGHARNYQGILDRLANRENISRSNILPVIDFENIRQLDAQSILGSMIANNMVANCLVADAKCMAYEATMTDAGQRALIEAAGEASMFQRFAGHAMNVLLFIYIAMTPILIFVIIVMGVKGWKLVAAYLMFCAWISSWLPITNAIAYYMLKNYIDNMYAFGRIILNAARGGEAVRALSPTFIHSMMKETSDMIATASTMMSSSPLIMLSLLSGSIYGMVQLAQRASMTTKDYVNEDRLSGREQLDRSSQAYMSTAAQATGYPMILNSHQYESIAQNGFHTSDSNDGKFSINTGETIGAGYSAIAKKAQQASEQIAMGRGFSTSLVSDTGASSRMVFTIARGDENRIGDSERVGSSHSDSLARGKSASAGTATHGNAQLGVSIAGSGMTTGYQIKQEDIDTEQKQRKFAQDYGISLDKVKGMYMAYTTGNDSAFQSSLTAQEREEYSHSLQKAFSNQVEIANSFTEKAEYAHTHSQTVDYDTGEIRQKLARIDYEGKWDEVIMDKVVSSFSNESDKQEFMELAERKNYVGIAKFMARENTDNGESRMALYTALAHIERSVGNEADAVVLEKAVHDVEKIADLIREGGNTQSQTQQQIGKIDFDVRNGRDIVNSTANNNREKVKNSDLFNNSGYSKVNENVINGIESKGGQLNNLGKNVINSVSNELNQGRPNADYVILDDLNRAFGSNNPDKGVHNPVGKRK